METDREPAFSIEVDEVNGKFILICNKGLAGPMANQLKHTGNQRKGASILRRMGRDIADAGNKLYGNLENVEGNVDSRA